MVGRRGFATNPKHAAALRSVVVGGRFDTDVLANRMFSEMFTRRDYGMAAAVAVILLALIVPIMLFNIRRFREQEAIR